MDVLVLSIVYRPVAVTDWQDAFTMVYSGRAEILETYSDKFVRSASQEWAVPSVIRFLRKRTAKMFNCEPRFTRKNIWIRDKGLCQYCGKAVTMHRFTLDHVLPKSRGGRTDWGNIVVACDPCNQRKEAKTPVEANMLLRSHPATPSVLPIIGNPGNPVLHTNVHETWKPYLV